MYFGSLDWLIHTGYIQHELGYTFSHNLTTVSFLLWQLIPTTTCNAVVWMWIQTHPNYQSSYNRINGPVGTTNSYMSLLLWKQQMIRIHWSLVHFFQSLPNSKKSNGPIYKCRILLSATVFTGWGKEEVQTTGRCGAATPKPNLTMISYWIRWCMERLRIRGFFSFLFFSRGHSIPCDCAVRIAAVGTAHGFGWTTY